MCAASATNNDAFVVTGNVPGKNCYGAFYQVNLGTKTSTLVPSFPGCGLGPSPAFLSSSTDGSMVAFGQGGSSGGSFCVYDAGTQQVRTVPNTQQLYGAAVTGDGNALAAVGAFIDPNVNLLGSIAVPAAYCGSMFTRSTELFAPPGYAGLQAPRLNSAGSGLTIP